MRRNAVLPIVLSSCALTGMVIGVALVSGGRSPGPSIRAAAATSSAGTGVPSPTGSSSGYPSPTNTVTLRPTPTPTVTPTSTSTPPLTASPSLSPTPAPTPTITATPTPTPSSPGGPAGPWSCREGATQAGTQLDVTGTVCARYAGNRWEARTSLRLTSRGPEVTGTATLLFEVLPEDPRFDVLNVPIHVPAGGSLTVPLRLAAAVRPADIGGWFEASVQGNWVSGNGSGDSGSLSSPIVRRTGPAARAYPGGRNSAKVCAKGAINYPAVKGTYSYCTQQVGARLRGSGSISYTTDPATTSVFLTMGQAVNTDRPVVAGQTMVSTRVATSTVMLPGSTSRTTVALPTLDSELLSGDLTAQAYAFEGTTPDVSPILTLR